LNKFWSRNENYRIISSKLIEFATALSPTINYHYAVPLETVQTYTQRHELYEELQGKLRARRKNASLPQAVAIHGLGSTGKSQLALRYAKDNRDRFNPILWIDAASKETVLSSFERCAAELGLWFTRSEKQSSPLIDSGAIQAVLRYLRNMKEVDDEWLVIVDNADDFTWGIKKVIPKGKRGSVIITSQDNRISKLVDGGCEQVKVDIMTPIEGTSLLLQHLQWDIDSVPEKIRQRCEVVVQRLGYLALAVDLAGMCFSATACCNK
jgi:NB-ARC domain-containing protein